MILLNCLSKRTANINQLKSIWRCVSRNHKNKNKQDQRESATSPPIPSQLHSSNTNTFAKNQSMQRGDLSSNPLRAMVFIDGTWLYYSLVEGRHDRDDPVINLLGKDWNKHYRIDWHRLPSLLARNLSLQLHKQYNPRQHVEIVRTSVFASLRSDSVVGGGRERMLNDFYEANFDVHRYETKTAEEKCADVALAVEMLYSSVVDAYDIAIIVTADKDFIPALEKVRLLAKKVAICSMRNSVNRDLDRPDGRIRDFDMIWLDDCIQELFVSKRIEDVVRFTGATSLDTVLLTSIAEKLALTDGPVSSRAIGRYLQTKRSGSGQTLHEVAKSFHGSIKLLLEKYPQYFTLSGHLPNQTSEKEYGISLTRDLKATEEESKSILRQVKDSPKGDTIQVNEEEEKEEEEEEAFKISDDPVKAIRNSVQFQKLYSAHSNLKVKEIKAKLEKLGIKKLSGTKHTLLERLCFTLVSNQSV